MKEEERAAVAKESGLLKEYLLKLMPIPGKYSTAVEGLSMLRRESGNHVENCFYKPSIGLIVQGRKHSRVGSEEYVYGENQCLLVSVDMPSSFSASEATHEHPFLAVSLDLDRFLIARLAMELPVVPDPGSNTCKGVVVADADFDLVNAFLRLVSLLERRDQVAFLAPAVVQEIHYRLLAGPLGKNLQKFSILGTQGNQIARAVAWLRENYKEPLRVEELARRVSMGTSTFHRHFKQVTTLSPLQYHKRLRLYEAQRLMLMEGADAASAGLSVGYESPTQFSREYKRMFGEPPRRDVMRRR